MGIGMQIHTIEFTHGTEEVFPKVGLFLYGTQLYVRTRVPRYHDPGVLSPDPLFVQNILADLFRTALPELEWDRLEDFALRVTEVTGVCELVHRFNPEDSVLVPKMEE